MFSNWLQILQRKFKFLRLKLKIYSDNFQPEYLDEIDEWDPHFFG